MTLHIKIGSRKVNIYAGVGQENGHSPAYLLRPVKTTAKLCTW
jgi:hypothetical protein